MRVSLFSYISCQNYQRSRHNGMAKLKKIECINDCKNKKNVNTKSWSPKLIWLSKNYLQLNSADFPKLLCFMASSITILLIRKSCSKYFRLNAQPEIQILIGLYYDITGYGVSSPGIQNKKDFCLKINIPKGIYWI